MQKQQVMDRTGHTTHAFDKDDIVSLEEAEKRFLELTGKGFFAFEPGKDGGYARQLKSFDPNAETTIFSPALQGG